MTTYEFAEDAGNGRWQLIEKVSGGFDEGQWTPKGAINMQLTNTHVRLIYSPTNIREIPISNVTVPSFTDQQTFFDNLAAIVF